MAKQRSTGRIVAIKLCLLENNILVYQKAIREISILRQLSQMEENSHTIKLIDIIAPRQLTERGERLLFLITDYVPLSIHTLL